MYRCVLAAVAVLILAMVAPITAEEKSTIKLFNGKNTKGWKFKGDASRSKWVIGKAALDEKNPAKLAVTPEKPGDLINGSTGVDVYTEKKFGDALIEVEFMVPKGSNSGVYVMGEYEVQILDSYGKEKVGPGDVGGLYGAAAPKVNATKAPGEWQKFVIEWQAPKFEGGKKVSNGKFIKVTLNDTVIHENVEMKGPTPSGVTGKEAPTGPLMFQGDHGPVAFRNIRITPR